MIGIYCITCIPSTKVYFGKHDGDPEAYLNLNYGRARGRSRQNDKPLLYRAMRKYERPDFVIHTVVQAIDDEQANALEKFFIRTTDARNPEFGYNLAEGGTGGNTSEGRKHRPESIEKMRLAQLGKEKSPAHRRNLSIAKIGTSCPAVVESNIRRRGTNPTAHALACRRYRERLKHGTNPRAGQSAESSGRE